MKEETQRKSLERAGRIRKIREYFCYGKNTEFAKKLGVSANQGSALCTGKQSIGLESLEKVLIAFPEISRHWLLTGEGSMIAKSTEENSNPASATSASSVVPTEQVKPAPVDATSLLIESLNARLADKDSIIKIQQEKIEMLEAKIKELSNK